MQQYKFFQALGLAFFSKPLYRDVAQNWQGRGFLYILFLVVLLTLASVFSYFSARTAFIAAIQPMIMQLPTITIENGQASIDKPEPYYIKDKDGKDVMIIDTSGKVTNFENTTAEVLLTKTEGLVKRSSSVPESFSLSKVKNGVYDQQTINRAIKYASFGFIFAFVIFIFLWRWLRGILAVLILAAVGKLLTHTILPYPTLSRIAAVASTPAIILAIVLELFHFSIPFIVLAYIALTVFYFFYGIEANKPVVTIQPSHPL